MISASFLFLYVSAARGKREANAPLRCDTQAPKTAPGSHRVDGIKRLRDELIKNCNIGFTGAEMTYASIQTDVPFIYVW